MKQPKVYVKKYDKIFDVIEIHFDINVVYFDDETTRDLLWYVDMAKRNDEIMYFEYELRGIKINLMDVSNIECEEI